MFRSVLHSRPIFRFAACLALWALLLPAFLPLAHHAAAFGGAAQPICHASMGGGDHQQGPAQEKAPPSCPICQSLSILAQGFVAPDVVTPEVFAVASLNFPDEGLPFEVFSPTSAAWPRAPPAFA